MKRAISLILTAFMGTVALCGVAPAATSRGDVSRTTATTGASRATTAPTIGRTTTGNAAARTTLGSERVTAGNATARSSASATGRTTDATARDTTTSRATVAPNVSRAATTSATSRAVTKTASATTRRGTNKNTVVGRATSVRGSHDGSIPSSSGTDNYVGIEVAPALRTGSDVYTNLTNYLQLSDSKNKKTLIFKLDSSNKLPSLQTFFGKIGTSNIAGIFSGNTATDDTKLVDSTGNAVNGQTFTGGRTYYMLAAVGNGGAGDGGNTPGDTGDMGTTGGATFPTNSGCPESLQNYINTKVTNINGKTLTCTNGDSVYYLVHIDSETCAAYFVEEVEGVTTYSVCEAVVNCNLSHDEIISNCSDKKNK